MTIQNDPSPAGEVTREARRAVRWLWPTLILLLLATAGLALHIAEEILEGDVFASDRAILLALRDPADPGTPIGPAWLRQSAVDVTALGGFTLLWLFGAAGVIYLLMRRRRAEAAWIAASLIGSALINSALKSFFHRVRPDVVPHLVDVSSASFPSGHAMSSAAIYLTLGVMLAETDPRPVGRMFIMGFMTLLSVAIGCTRVYLGVHWPSDVVAGWCFGATWALIVFAANRWLRRQERPGR
jgi:undecaprenyl-diphosphatase